LLVSYQIVAEVLRAARTRAFGAWLNCLKWTRIWKLATSSRRKTIIRQFKRRTDIR